MLAINDYDSDLPPSVAQKIDKLDFARLLIASVRKPVYPAGVERLPSENLRTKPISVRRLKFAFGWAYLQTILFESLESYLTLGKN